MRAGWGLGRAPEAYRRVEVKSRGRRADPHPEGGCEECFRQVGVDQDDVCVCVRA